MSAVDALTERVRADPDDASAWAVLQDALLAAGDPRGELMVANRSAIEALLRERAPAWYGRPVRVEGRRLEMRVDLADRHAPGVLLDFARGHVRALTVETTWDGARDSWGQEWIPDLLRRVLQHPTGRLVHQITLRATPWTEFRYEGLVEALADAAPLAVRRLYAGDDDQLSWTNVPDPSALWAAAPYLDAVTLEGASIRLGRPDHPRLRRLVLRTGGLGREPLAALAAADLPALEELELWFGDPEYGAECAIGDVLPLLRRPFPSLRRLALVNCAFADALAEAVAESPWVEQLDALALGRGVLRDAGARALIAASARLGRLRLDVRESYLSEATVRALHAVWGERLVADDQREPEHWGGAEHFYVTVGE